VEGMTANPANPVRRAAHVQSMTRNPVRRAAHVQGITRFSVRRAAHVQSMTPKTGVRLGMPSRSMNVGIVELIRCHAQPKSSILYVAAGAKSRTNSQGGIKSGLHVWVISLKPNSNFECHLSF